ncbi:unnamed protein product [Rotaria sordida]|uniref:Integrase catalytic domain-containing protein n=1 Tax=Rotaria sordida TaxID=392033 RepID=A0A814BWQ9_9BILA|nr:unnamed protein product [Rotaria sordida]
MFTRAVKTNSAQEVVNFYLDVCYHYGAPAKLITDQRSHFVAELTRTIIESCNTTHVLATSYYPTSSAQIERCDLVLIRVVNRTSKFQEKYVGPYRIIDQKDPSTFVVKIEDRDGDENSH